VVVQSIITEGRGPDSLYIAFHNNLMMKDIIAAYTRQVKAAAEKTKHLRRSRPPSFYGGTKIIELLLLK